MISEDAFLYEKIADSLRKGILEGEWKPGDKLPSVREMCVQWNCTPGTIQRAYKLLSSAGLIVSSAGKGTRVAGIIPKAEGRRQGVLRKANLAHRAEDFLLEVLTAGYDLNEIQGAIDLAMDRWRALETEPFSNSHEILRFVGSNDMAVNGLAHTFFGEVEKSTSLQISISGSLGGLVALSESKADFCGCHLWDPGSSTYNLNHVRRIFPEKNVLVITLAHRNLGLITAPGNPLQIHSVADLTRKGIRFVNRQEGSGTRVWLDSELIRLSIQPVEIEGYVDERMTHSDIARAVAEDSADAGVGLESAAAAFGLEFVLLAKERYDLVMREETSLLPVMKHLITWLQSCEGKNFINQYKGYDNTLTGQVIEI